jgi:hypothetical protein
VPPSVRPPAVIIAPGASSDRYGAEFEKHAIVSTSALASVHDVGELQLRRPSGASYVAPTLTAPGAHAGVDSPPLQPLLPDATADSTPWRRASVTPVAIASSAHGEPKGPAPPRERLIAQMLRDALLASTHEIAASTSEV